MQKDWDVYFISVTDVIKLKSPCVRRNVGAIIVQDNRIISTGYNGLPSKFPNCNVYGCYNEQRVSGKGFVSWGGLLPT